MVYVDPRLHDKPSPVVSVARMEGDHVARLNSLKGSALAFLDQRIPAYEREIINIIGMGGRRVHPDYICGAAGNAALIGFTQALGAETPSYNVRVFGINPAATMTDRIVELSKSRAKARFGDERRWQEVLNADKLPFGRIKTAEEVAAVIADVIATGRVGDVYTRPEGFDRVIKYLRDLAAGT